MNAAAVTEEASVVFAGDTSLGDWYLRHADASLQRRLEYEPMSFVEKLSPLVAKADLFVVNLETVLYENASGPLAGRKKYPGWDRPERTIGVLQALGVDAAGLANNHTMDFGPEVLAATIERLSAAGMRSFGAGRHLAAAGAPLVHEIRHPGCHRRIYVCAGMQTRRTLRQYGFFSGRSRWGVYPLHGRVLRANIRILRDQQPDALIVVYPHWGNDYRWASPDMRRAARSWIHSGADLVVGHGSHMLQEIAAIDGGTVLYSLGNFVFNSPGRYRKRGMHPFSAVCRLSVGVRDDRWFGSLRLYPIVSDNLTTGYRPRPVLEAEMAQVFDTLRDRSREGSARFTDAFSVERDERGWHVLQRAPLSVRFA